MASGLHLWWQKSRLYSTLRSWWEQIQEYRRAIGVVAIVLIVVVVIALVIIVVLSNGIGINGYNKVSTVHTISGPSAGTVTRTEEYQPGKTLWDLLQLLIVPVVLAIAGFWFNRIQKSREERATEQRDKTEREIAKDNQQEAALQAYLDKMSELLLKEHLDELTLKGELNPEYSEVRKIARVRTLTVLRGLDANRKASVLKFLHESGLIDQDQPIIDLNGADLSGAYLHQADLSGVDLSGAYLHQADLSIANLYRANLSEAHMSEVSLSSANLPEASLCWAYLREADLSYANLSGADLREAWLIETNLRGANLPEANLGSASLRGADLRGAYLGIGGANRIFTNVMKTWQSRANLEVDLREADLREANLKDATGITVEELVLQW